MNNCGRGLSALRRLHARSDLRRPSRPPRSDRYLPRLPIVLVRCLRERDSDARRDVVPLSNHRREDARAQRTNADLAKCPRCKGRLRRTHDMQRATKFEYLSCPNAHGRLTTFFDFLREKDFIRPLTPQQIEELRRNVQSVNCANCGAPVDVTVGAACAHCGTPLSMLDLKQAEKLVAQLQKAEIGRTSRSIRRCQSSSSGCGGRRSGPLQVLRDDDLWTWSCHPRARISIS